MKKRILLLVIVVVIVGLSLWSWRHYRVSRVARVSSPQPWWRIWLEEVSGGVWELHGNVEIREVRLGFKVPGRIMRLHVDEGDTVKPGQLLAELDQAEFLDAVHQAEAALEARRAELAALENGSRPEEIEKARALTEAARVAMRNAEISLRRAKELAPKGAVSQEMLDNAQAAYDQALANYQAAVASQRLVEIGPRQEDIDRARGLVRQAEAVLKDAQRRLNDTKLLSPVSGVVQVRVHEVGDFVNTGEPVFSIARQEEVWVRTYVAEEDLDRIRPGMQVTVLTDGGNQFQGRVGFISSVAEFTPKTVETREVRTNLVYRVRVLVSDPERKLRQGMPVRVRISAENASAVHQPGKQP
ncbi:efflux RND transporter periplasmic adaptor subunit [Thermogutta sp.]|uniref:efflux RND transporter periplasmic adaptor subunit n=1 Tax=Thermogutta sp. TaxID=1962930 RepID=UPI003C7CE287